MASLRRVFGLFSTSTEETAEAIPQNSLQTSVTTDAEIQEQPNQRRIKTAESERRPRKSRSDKGAIRQTVRDIQELTWIGEQMVVEVFQIRKLLGRNPKNKAKQTKEAGTVAEATARRVIERWVQLGYAQRGTVGRYDCVWLTKKGQNAVGLPYSKAWSKGEATLRHYLYVNEVRLLLEQEWNSDMTWKSERQLVYEKEHTGKHYPDAVVEINGEHAAIEVELTAKSKRATLEDMRRLAEKYDNVWYYTVKRTTRSVENRIKALRSDVRESFEVNELEEPI